VTGLSEEIGKVKPVGGGDLAEDVFGGLVQVLDLDWKGSIRVLAHIADAPGHDHTGTNLMHKYKDGDKNPDGIRARSSLQINYWLRVSSVLLQVDRSSIL